MTNHTSSAHQIYEVFSRFHSLDGLDGRPLSYAWNLILEAKDSPEIFFERLAAIARVLEKLAEEIDACGRLNKHSRAIAYRTLSGLREVIQAGHLHLPAKQLAANYDEDRLGIIQMLGASLQVEFPKGILNEDVQRSLRDEVAELTGLINDADIEANLKGLLRRHAMAMLWAIENVDIIGFDEVYAAILRAMMGVRRSDPDNAKTTGLSARLFAAGRTIMAALDKAEKVAHVAHEAIGAADDITKLLS